MTWGYWYQWGYGPGYGRGYGRGWGRGFGRGMGPWSFQTQLPSLPPPPPNSIRVVISTEDDRGIEGIISPRFGRSPYFTVVDIQDKRIVNVHVVNNNAMNLPHGVGMIVAQWIVSNGVNVVIAAQLGPNVQYVLQQAGINVIYVTPGIRVIDALRQNNLII